MVKESPLSGRLCDGESRQNVRPFSRTAHGCPRGAEGIQPTTGAIPSPIGRRWPREARSDEGEPRLKFVRAQPLTRPLRGHPLPQGEGRALSCNIGAPASEVGLVAHFSGQPLTRLPDHPRHMPHLPPRPRLLLSIEMQARRLAPPESCASGRPLRR
jgi:hypothetical protein